MGSGRMVRLGVYSVVGAGSVLVGSVVASDTASAEGTFGGDLGFSSMTDQLATADFRSPALLSAVPEPPSVSPTVAELPREATYPEVALSMVTPQVVAPPEATSPEVTSSVVTPAVPLAGVDLLAAFPADPNSLQSSIPGVESGIPVSAPQTPAPQSLLPGSAPAPQTSVSTPRVPGSSPSVDLSGGQEGSSLDSEPVNITSVEGNSSRSSGVGSRDKSNDFIPDVAFVDFEVPVTNYDNSLVATGGNLEGLGAVPRQASGVGETNPSGESDIDGTLMAGVVKANGIRQIRGRPVERVGGVPYWKQEPGELMTVKDWESVQEHLQTDTASFRDPNVERSLYPRGPKGDYLRDVGRAQEGAVLSLDFLSYSVREQTGRWIPSNQYPLVLPNDRQAFEQARQYNTIKELRNRVVQDSAGVYQPGFDLEKARERVRQLKRLTE